MDEERSTVSLCTCLFRRMCLLEIGIDQRSTFWPGKRKWSRTWKNSAAVYCGNWQHKRINSTSSD